MWLLATVGRSAVEIARKGREGGEKGHLSVTYCEGEKGEIPGYTDLCLRVLAAYH
jgi:hypothetical protein